MGKEKGQGGEWGWEIRKGDSGRGRRRGGKRNGEEKVKPSKTSATVHTTKLFESAIVVWQKIEI